MTSPVDDEPEQHGHVHRDVSGGWLRPTIFGAMDGLVTNTSLIAGVGGGGGDRQALVLTGLAGLVAGACSMAIGEWVSVRSQNQMVQAEVQKEAVELERSPDAETAELAAIFRSHGMEPATARSAAAEIARDPQVALRFHAREELGVDPQEVPSPWVAAGSSFASFSVGAIIPLLPLLLGVPGLLWPLLLASVAAFAGGALVTRVTGRAWWRGGVQQLLLVLAATGITHLVGLAIGAAVT